MIGNTEKDLEKEKIIDDTLNKTERKIYNIIKSNNNVTQLEIAETLGISKITVKRNIATLKEKRFIERVGSNKKGYWKVLDNK